MAQLDIHNPPSMITTQTGHFDLMNPDPAMVDLDAIATSLSRQVRYTGHSDFPITIGQHLLICAHIAEYYYAAMDKPKLMLAVLLHDAHEAYTGDICRPLKHLINARADNLLELIEHKVDTAIYGSLGLNMVDMAEFKSVVKGIDNWALACETYTNFTYAYYEWAGLAEVPDELADVVEVILDQPEEDVEDAWLNLVRIYSGRLADQEDYEFA